MNTQTLAETPAALTLEREFMRQLPSQATAELERLDVDEAVAILARQPPADTARVWERLSPATAQQYIVDLPEEQAAEILTMMNPTRAGRLLGGLDAEDRERLFKELPEATRDLVGTVMKYPAGTAGALMDPRVIFLRHSTSVGDAIERVRAISLTPGRSGARQLFYLVDEDERLDGIVEAQDLILARPSELLDAYAQPASVWAEVETGEEDVVELIEKHGMSSLPVLDNERRLVGVVRYDTLVAATRADASVDLQTIFGVSKEEGALSTAGFAIRKRLPWLQINLVTAFIAASVVGLFEDTIASYTALAVLLPVVAGQSGNTGAQALAVVIRALALHEITAAHWRQVVKKEFLTGLVNGLAVASTTAAGVYVWSRSWGLSLIIGLSMVASMVMAGLAGGVTPIILTKLRQDPAQSSSIVLTTLTDVVGFFSFLGIATLLLHTL